MSDRIESMSSEMFTKENLKKRGTVRVVTNLIALIISIIAAILGHRRDSSGSLVKCIIFLVALEVLRWADILYAKIKASRESGSIKVNLGGGQSSGQGGAQGGG